MGRECFLAWRIRAVVFVGICVFEWFGCGEEVLMEGCLAVSHLHSEVPQKTGFITTGARLLEQPPFLNKQPFTCHSISRSTGRTGRKSSLQTRWLRSEWTHSWNAKRQEVAHRSTMKHPMVSIHLLCDSSLLSRLLLFHCTYPPSQRTAHSLQ